MDPTTSNLASSNEGCYNCTEEYQRLRPSVSHCSHCNHSFCSECLLIHREKNGEAIKQLHDQYNELTNKINEKEKYINDTSNESLEIVHNWYQRIINDLIESQTQIIETIQNERDRARDELAQFDLNIHSINKDMEQVDPNIHSIETKLTDLRTKLINYQISKDIYLPDSRTFQPRYKIFYEFKNSSSAEEDWDIDANESTNIPLPSHLSLLSPHTTATTTTPFFFSDTSQTFVTPKDDDDDDDGDDHFNWSEEIDESNDNNSEYLLDPKLYQLGTSRHFNYDIHLIASNGNDLLSYSKQSKQLIFVGDGNVNPITLQWYHGHIIQLAWFDSLKSFVILTGDNQYEMYTIESTYSLRLKIRLRTSLPKANVDIVKDQIFLRTDECHMFIYYERINRQKRLRLLNPTFECVQSYPIDKFFQKYERRRSRDNGFVVGLGVNQEYVVLFVRSTVDDDLAGQAVQQIDDTRLLVFNKSKMCFIRRIILENKYFDLPFIVHFINISSFFIIDQTCHVLRFYNYEKEIGQIKLLPSNTSPIFNSTTISKSIKDFQYSSIVLMNDGSLLISDNTTNLIQLILTDQSNDVDDW